MRLVVRKDSLVVNELQFQKGPVKIGRHAGSQIFLPERSVSRHHAVLINVNGGGWHVEDLESINKTYLNGELVSKMPLKSGDTIQITNFTIEVNLEDEMITGQAINLEDTLTTPEQLSENKKSRSHETLNAATQVGDLELQTVVRRLDIDHACDVCLPAKRIRDFLEASETICKTDTLDGTLQAMITVLMKQFLPLRVWCGLRTGPEGPLLAHLGKHRAGTRVQLSDLSFKDQIDQVLEKPQFLLIPRIPKGHTNEAIHSSMIAPVLGKQGCFGVIYVDNDMSHEHYSLSELDYLALLSIHVAVIVENF